MSNVTALKVVKSAKSVSKSKRMSKRLRRQGAAAVGVGLVAGTLTALSLSHLAHGIEVVTAAPSWEAWAMAVGIDLGFVMLELSQLAAATDKVAKHISRFTKPAIVGTLVGSAAMNGFAFAAQVSGLMIAPAVVLGLAIPGLIYAMTRVGAGLYIDCHSRG